jgi:hypothetical protein
MRIDHYQEIMQVTQPQSGNEYESLRKTLTTFESLALKSKNVKRNWEGIEKIKEIESRFLEVCGFQALFPSLILKKTWAPFVEVKLGKRRQKLCTGRFVLWNRREEKKASYSFSILRLTFNCQKGLEGKVSSIESCIIFTYSCVQH